MKKLMILTLFALMFFLSSCSNDTDNVIKNLEGRYFYHECIYLTPLSSSTKNWQTQKYNDMVYIEFSDDQIIYFGSDEMERRYNEIQFKKEDIYKDLDSVISLDFEGVFNSFDFDYRYDIYSKDMSIGLTLFIKEDTYYLAETKMIGGSKDIFHVWSIFEINK